MPDAKMAGANDYVTQMLDSVVCWYKQMGSMLPHPRLSTCAAVKVLLVQFCRLSMPHQLQPSVCCRAHMQWLKQTAASSPLSLPNSRKQPTNNLTDTNAAQVGKA